MARPLRIEFPGAIYHVTSRGDRREPIFEDDVDRENLLDIVGQALARFDAEMLAYCLMGNHYHFVLHTRRANLSLLMRHINGVYTQRYNRRHAKAGHLFQGRFKAILVDRDAYLFEVCRYVELNPVRANIVQTPGDWRWSSYLAHTDQAAAPVWLDIAGLHGYVLGRTAHGAADHRRAATRYAALVASAQNVRLWDENLRHQIYLGDDDFIARMQAQALPQRVNSNAIPKAQRKRIGSRLTDFLAGGASREEALHRAYTEGGISMTALAREMGLSVSHVSRLIAKMEKGK